MTKRTRQVAKTPERVTLKVVANCVGLAMGTVSVILNHAPQADAIPKQTRERVFAAARRLNYRPNPFARALRTRHLSTSASTPRVAGASRALVFEGPEQFQLALHAIRRAGLRVPGDVSVVGADDVATVS
jgi:DNA-binding LacI/PurR family transcriptional regulator